MKSQAIDTVSCAFIVDSSEIFPYLQAYIVDTTELYAVIVEDPVLI